MKFQSQKLEYTTWTYNFPFPWTEKNTSGIYFSGSLLNYYTFSYLQFPVTQLICESTKICSIYIAAVSIALLQWDITKLIYRGCKQTEHLIPIAYTQTTKWTQDMSCLQFIHLFKEVSIESQLPGKHSFSLIQKFFRTLFCFSFAVFDLLWFCYCHSVGVFWLLGLNKKIFQKSLNSSQQKI